MHRAFLIQTGSSITVILAVLLAEAVALALETYPGSELSWYLKLEVFRAFDYARHPASPIRSLFTPVTFHLCLILVALATAVCAFRQRLAVALLANLSFIFAACLCYCWVSGHGPYAALHESAGGLLVGALTLVSFAGFATSHLSYILDARTAWSPTS